tara:strand:- start:9391 stop:10218 length:828 start_codon:yes stop_codon:yes gene_type:complete
MQIINNKESLSEILKEYKSIGNKISLIPTMGNLHRGHQELFSSAPDRTIKITTIYINPLQFNNSDDYDSYPRTLNHDLEICKKNNINIVYAPDGDISNEIDIEKNIDLPKFTRYLCGQSREDHFCGVYKIVKHLFKIINPDYACFGKKDYQQLLLIKYIASTYFPNLKIIEVDTVRINNIALSSRLKRLSDESLREVKIIYDVLLNLRHQIVDGKKFDNVKEDAIKDIESHDIYVEYLEHRNNETLELANGQLDNSTIFIAYKMGDIRLIDNVQI